MENHTGKKFGKLTVISKSKRKNKKTYCTVKCDCGKVYDVLLYSLKRGDSKSCGCARNYKLMNLVHGKTGTSEYRSWAHLKGRCNNPNDIKYPLYGARGIKVCFGYINSFKNFFTDLGLKPTPDYSVDRIDNDMNYSCGKCEECIKNGWKINVRWGTEEQQQGNRRNNHWIEYNGEKMIIANWARKLNINAKRLWKYLKRHKSMESAINHYTSPNKNGRKLYKSNGESLTQSEWARKLNVDLKNFSTYVNRYSFERAISHYSK